MFHVTNAPETSCTRKENNNRLIVKEASAKPYVNNGRYILLSVTNPAKWLIIIQTIRSNNIWKTQKSRKIKLCYPPSS